MAGVLPRWVVSCFRSQRAAALPQHSLDVYIKLWAFYDCLQSLWPLCVRTTSKLLSVSNKASVLSQVRKRTSINTYWSTVWALWESRSDKCPVCLAPASVPAGGNTATSVEGGTSAIKQTAQVQGTPQRMPSACLVFRPQTWRLLKQTC